MAGTDGATMALNGTEIFVRRMGTGEPIIVVHGGPVLEHGYLLPHLAPLAESAELIFFDQRLSGRSAAEVDSSSVRLQTFVDDIDSLRAVLGLERVHVLAHSWGGLLALLYAAQHPDRVGSLILISPMPPSAVLWQAEQTAARELRTVEDSVVAAQARESEAFQQRTSAGIRRVLLASFRSQFKDRDLVRELDLYVPDDYQARSRQFGFMAPDLMSFDLTTDLGRITAPTLILYGSAEPAAALGGNVLDTEITHSELVVVSDAGHFMFIERPLVFQSIVQTFVAEHSSGGPR
jgi:proline iminopeptidase